MNSSDDVVSLAREEAQAVSHRRLERSLPSADAHTTARARREYIETQRGISARVIESLHLQENSMSTDQTSNHNTDDQEKDPADLSFPAQWPVTGPFANNTDDQE